MRGRGIRKMKKSRMTPRFRTYVTGNFPICTKTGDINLEKRCFPQFDFSRNTSGKNQICPENNREICIGHHVENTAIGCSGSWSTCVDDSFGETQQSKETQGVAATAATIVPAPQVSVTLHDAPQRDVSQFGSRMDPASFNITISYLRMTESSQAQFTLTCHALRGKDTIKAVVVEKLSSLPFQKVQHSITVEDHHPTPDSCIISMASLRPMKIPSCGATRCSC